MIVWIASYPRSGNTFFRVLLNSIFNIKTYSLYNDQNDIAADKETANVVGHEMLPEEFDIEVLRNSDETYYIKTHEKPSIVDVNDKIVYLVRDGRESSLSYMNWLNNYSSDTATLNDVIAGSVAFGSWGNHVEDWSSVNGSDKLLLRFEDLISDPVSQAQHISKFIGVAVNGESLPSFEELHKINPAFFRSGKVDSWKSAYSEGQILYFNFKNHALLLANDYDVPPFAGEGVCDVADASALVEYFEDKVEGCRVYERKLETDYDGIARRYALLEQDLAAKSEHLLNVTNLVAEKDKQLAKKDDLLIDRDRLLSERYDLLLEQYHKVEQRNDQLSVRGNKIVELNHALAKNKDEHQKLLAKKKAVGDSLRLLKQDVYAVISTKLLRKPLYKLKLYKKLGQRLHGKKYT